MSEIRFRSDIKVTLGAHCGSDSYTSRAAWVVPPDKEDKRDDRVGQERLIRSCLPVHHNTPFEHGLMSVYLEAPGVVWWQLTRQRFMSLDSEDFSFSIESGRYRVLDAEFYRPPPERPTREPDGFKPMRPELVLGPQSQLHDMHERFTDAAENCWRNYQAMVDAGTARELARLVLPNWMLYCDGYCSAKPLTWLQFFQKRVKVADNKIATFPQWEIEDFAKQCEVMFAELWPEVYRAFLANGRVAP